MTLDDFKNWNTRLDLELKYQNDSTVTDLIKIAEWLVADNGYLNGEVKTLKAELEAHRR